MYLQYAGIGAYAMRRTKPYIPRGGSTLTERALQVYDKFVSRLRNGFYMGNGFV